MHVSTCAPPAVLSAAMSSGGGPVCCPLLPGQTGRTLPELISWAVLQERSGHQQQGLCDNFHITAFLGQLWQNQGTPHCVLYVHKEWGCVLTLATERIPELELQNFELLTQPNPEVPVKRAATTKGTQDSHRAPERRLLFVQAQ